MFSKYFYRAMSAEKDTDTSKLIADAGFSTPNECFENAIGGFEFLRDLGVDAKVVEGYLVFQGGMPCLHYWILSNNKIVDPTLVDQCDLEENYYFGVIGFTPSMEPSNPADPESSIFKRPLFRNCGRPEFKRKAKIIIKEALQLFYIMNFGLESFVDNHELFRKFLDEFDLTIVDEEY